ncbi:hypothetical protein ACKKBG_A07915 [Auxenochlorella protothecoides x Auxenochlorella symbiontica]
MARGERSPSRARPRWPWSHTLVFHDPVLEAEFELEHGAQHRAGDAAGSFILSGSLLTLTLLTMARMTDQLWAMAMDETRSMALYSLVEAIPGLLALLLPAEAYLRSRTRLHQAMLLFTSLVMPFHGYTRSPDLVSGASRRGQAAWRAAVRLGAGSKFPMAALQLLGRPLLLHRRLPCVVVWTLMALQCNLDFCRVRGWTEPSGGAIHDVHAALTRVANTGLGEWGGHTPAQPAQACAVISNWVLLVAGVVVPNAFLYIMEVRQRTRFLEERGLGPPRLKLSRSLEENFLLLPSVVGGMWLLANVAAAAPYNRVSALCARWNAVLMRTPVLEFVW